MHLEILSCAQWKGSQRGILLLCALLAMLQHTFHHMFGIEWIENSCASAQLGSELMYGQ
jgi:hypothetical protein